MICSFDQQLFSGHCIRCSWIFIKKSWVPKFKYHIIYKDSHLFVRWGLEHGNRGPSQLTGMHLTVVEVAEVSRVQEKVGSEKFSEAALAWPEGQRGVQVQAASPVGLSSQVVPCEGQNRSS